ncbi:MAG: 4Fe-4S dicluster domain-containing protein [Campylobacteraceae bacterium]
MGLNNQVYDFIIADPNVCTGCSACMVACKKAATERGKLAVARLIVERTKEAKMPNQCRQCDNAPCALVCPTGSLKFGKNCIEMHEEICIGCKMCTLACPFGAIRIEAEKMPSVNKSEYKEQYLYIESEVGAKSVAVKCDLCFEREAGPACIESCPQNCLHVIVSKSKDGVVKTKSKESVEAYIKATLIPKPQDSL